MALSTINTSDEKPDRDPQAVLTLTVGEAAFPLHRATVFGTLADNDRTYAFKPEFVGTVLGTNEG